MVRPEEVAELESGCLGAWRGSEWLEAVEVWWFVRDQEWA